MSKNIIYLISIFLLLGLTAGVANAPLFPFIQSGGDDGIVAMEAENYDVNVYKGPIRIDGNLVTHKWLTQRPLRFARWHCCFKPRNAVLAVQRRHTRNHLQT